MILREAIQQICGFRYMMEQLDICSAPGQRYLYELNWLNTEKEIKNELDRVAEVYEKAEQPKGKMMLEQIKGLLRQVRDIRGTVKRTGMQSVLDDLELYEIKNFALLTESIRELTGSWDGFCIPDLASVIDLLDPEGNRIPHFYIYDAYSGELAALRAEIRNRKQRGESEQQTELLYFRSVEMEDAVRVRLSGELQEYHLLLESALQQVALLDLTIAKAAQVSNMQLSRPQFGKGKTILRGLFNPQLQMILQQEGKTFQSVDIELVEEATVITGANMAGKTVLLKTIALTQCLFQWGFYVPAVEAEMVLVDGVFAGIGDEQNELNGLSSFAAEMLRVDEMTKQIKAGRKILVLLDELARTTNPMEGRAIVNGVIDFLTENRTMALVTTHYNGIIAPCRKLRVKGFKKEKVQKPVTGGNINEFIDYTLEEDRGDEVPHEAMRIAALLGVDHGLLCKAENYLHTRQLNK